MNRRYLAAVGLTLGMGALAPHAMADNPPRADFSPPPPADFSPPSPDAVREEASVTAPSDTYVAPSATIAGPAGAAPPDEVVVEDRSAVIVPAPTAVPGSDRLMVQPNEPSTQHRMSPSLFDPRGADYSGA